LCEPLTDRNVLADLFERSNLFATLPVKPHLRIDTTKTRPAEAAAEIVAPYSVPLR